MRNRNTVDYFEVCHTVWTVRVRILYSTTAGEIGGWPKARFCLPSELVRILPVRRNPALCSKYPHGICTLVKHIHSASRADWKWSILSVVYYRSWMECTAVVRTSQNGQFFIKSSILVLRSQHPHDICLLAKHVTKENTSVKRKSSLNRQYSVGPLHLSSHWPHYSQQ